MADPDTLTTAFRGDPGDVAEQEWLVPGESSYRMTYTPLPYWPHVVAGGCPQVDSRDYRVSGQTLTVLAAMDLQTDEELWVRYDYLEGMNAYVPPEPSVVAPVASGGYGGNTLYIFQTWPDAMQDGDLLLVAAFYQQGNAPLTTGFTVVGSTALGNNWEARLFSLVKDPVGNTPNLAGSAGGLMYLVYRGVEVGQLASSKSSGDASSLDTAALSTAHDLVVRFWGVFGGTALTTDTEPEFNGDIGGGRQGLFTIEAETDPAVAKTASSTSAARWASFTVGLDNL